MPRCRFTIFQKRVPFISGRCFTSSISSSRSFSTRLLPRHLPRSRCFIQPNQRSWIGTGPKPSLYSGLCFRKKWMQDGHSQCLPRSSAGRVWHQHKSASLEIVSYIQCGYFDRDPDHGYTRCGRRPTERPKLWQDGMLIWFLFCMKHGWVGLWLTWASLWPHYWCTVYFVLYLR